MGYAAHERHPHERIATDLGYELYSRLGVHRITWAGKAIFESADYKLKIVYSGRLINPKTLNAIELIYLEEVAKVQIKAVEGTDSTLTT